MTSTRQHTNNDSRQAKSDQKPQFCIRPLHFTEMWAASLSLCRIFNDDAHFGEVIHPHRDQYPTDPALWFYRRMQQSWFDWTNVFQVATIQNDQSEEVIAGVAWWTRLGEKEQIRKSGHELSSVDPRRLLQPPLTAASRLCNLFTPNRAADPDNEDIMERLGPYFESRWVDTPGGPYRRECWDLHILGVHPDYQGMGIGRSLAGWGIEQAKREGVSASVIASVGKDRFYNSCGFNVAAGNSGEGEGNPMAQINVKGGNIWFMDVPVS